MTPKPIKIETEECFVIKSSNTGLYLVGHPLTCYPFWRNNLDDAIRQYSFKTKKECEECICELIYKYNFIKEFMPFPEIAFRLKARLNY